MKTKAFIHLILYTLSFFLFNCQEAVEKFSNEDTPKIKKTVTINNIGEIHNELLTACYATQTRGESSTSNNLATSFEIFKHEFFDTEVYEFSTEDIEQCQASTVEFEEFMTIELDSTFYEKSSRLVLNRIKNNDGICNEVKQVIYEITADDCTLSADELCALAEKYKNYLGGDYLLVFSNIFKSSSEYWSPVATRSSNNRKIIVADCIGGLLGFTCGGAMSIVWGAAFSYSLDKCLEPNTSATTTETTVSTTESTNETQAIAPM